MEERKVNLNGNLGKGGIRNDRRREKERKERIVPTNYLP
jgi:hypothetical protein